MWTQHRIVHMILRLKRTPNLFPTNVLYPPIDSAPLQFILLCDAWLGYALTLSFPTLLMKLLKPNLIMFNKITSNAWLCKV